MILTLTYYFHIQYLPVGRWNGEELCFLCCLNRIRKYYFDGLSYKSLKPYPTSKKVLSRYKIQINNTVEIKNPNISVS
jgi:hypothetical protein